MLSSIKDSLVKFAKENKFFILIILFGSVLRLILLFANPPSLNWDEVSHGYNAYSILKTGRDEWGKTFPLIFRAYGDYKLPVYIYLTAISELFFGLNAFAVRFPSALAGIATIIFTYLLSKELFNKKVAILSALFVAIEPWSLFLSSGAFEANLSLAFITAGVYFFVKGTNKPIYYLLSTISLGFSVWTYNSARVFVPIFLAFLIYAYKKEIKLALKSNRTIIHASLFIILIFLLPMFWQMMSPEGQARYGKVAIVDAGAVSEIVEARNSSKFSPTLTRVIYNRPTYFIREFFTNWASHYSGNFLFFEGGSQYQFSVPGRGLIYAINAPLLIIGVAVLLKKRDRRTAVLLGLLYFGPVASALTREAPHVLRSITMLPAPMIIAAYGGFRLFEWFKSKSSKTIWLKVSVLVYFALLLGSFEGYLVNYFENYKREYSWSWQYGYEQVVDYAKEHYDEYDKIIVTKKYGEPHEFFLFYWPWGPQSYQNDSNLIRFNQSNWYWVDRFDKFYFVNDWDIPSEEREDFMLESGGSFSCTPGVQDCLLITSPDNYPKGWNKVDTINFLDDKPAFDLLEKKSN